MPTTESGLLKTHFYIGIEFEGMLRTEIAKEFRNGMRNLGQDEDGQSLVQFGGDNSIKNIPEGYDGVEIRTQIMTYYRGLRLFEEMLCFLYIASQTEDWLTNETCGLHVNLSEKDIFGKNKQHDFYAHLLRDFDEDMILGLFGRKENIFCRPAGLRNKSISAIRNQIDKKFGFDPSKHDRYKGPKYMAISLRDNPTHSSWQGGQQRAHRVEFRAVGNTDYHLHWDKLSTFMHHMHSVTRKAYRTVLEI